MGPEHEQLRTQGNGCEVRDKGDLAFVTMDRKAEIRMLLAMSATELMEAADGRLVIVDDLHAHFARSIADEIKLHNERGEPTRLILPVGPTNQYPRLAEILREERISLQNCYLFFMDEYADEEGRAISADHPLSFKGRMQELFFQHLPEELVMPPDQVVFPDHKNVAQLANRLERLGGIDTCYGGIGIHGHVAFNEPEPGIKDSGPRLVTLNDFTVTINAIRASVGGNLEGFPQQALTLGMKQIREARRIRLYCRSHGSYDWAKTVLRLAVLGRPGDDYPVTHIRGRDFKVITNPQTASPPEIIL